MSVNMEWPSCFMGLFFFFKEDFCIGFGFPENVFLSLSFSFFTVSIIPKRRSYSNNCFLVLSSFAKRYMGFKNSLEELARCWENVLLT